MPRQLTGLFFCFYRRLIFLKLEDAQQYELQGRYLDAEKIFRALLKSEPNNGQAHWGLGRLALKVGLLRLQFLF